MSALKWKAKQSSELKRLGSSCGWSLASSSSSSTKRVKVDFGMTTPPRNTTEEPEGRDGDEELDEQITEASSCFKSTKPAATRLILEAPMMKAMMESNIICRSCGAAVVVSFPTVCIASGCRIECSDPLCSFVITERPAAAVVPLPDDSGSPLIERNTDYAANVLWVLGFLSSGDGGKEAERLLGLLGMHNSTTMEKRSFNTIESALSPIIHELNECILVENLSEAVEKYYENEFLDGRLLFELWKEQIKPENSNIECWINT